MFGCSFAETLSDFATVNFGHLIVGKDGDNERAGEVFVTCFLAIETQLFETFTKFGSLFDLLGGEAKTEGAIREAKFEFLDQILVIKSTFFKVVTSGFVFGKEKTLMIVVHHFVQKFSVGGFRIEEAIEGPGLLWLGGDGGAAI